jgi:hypothetical protein
MGKRSDFERKPRDFYPTPAEAVLPLCSHLPGYAFTFVEPCAGDGALVRHLEKMTHGECNSATDIEPQHEMVVKSDIFDCTYAHINYAITNPPWDRKILHPIIEHLSSQIPTWLLFDADWMHTKQAYPYLPYCKKIVSIGRVKWFGKTSGKDNCAWYLFGSGKTTTQFCGRTE